MSATPSISAETKSDRFGNEWAEGVPYARGAILSSTEDDFKKMQVAWSHIRRRGAEQTFNLSGLEHGLPLKPEELPIASDFLAPALYFDEFQTAALSHMGGDCEHHDAALFNRITGATLATHLALVEAGDVVVGVSASYSHPSVPRASARVGATLIDTRGIDQFGEALARRA